MTTSNNSQQSHPGPVAQQLTKLQSNGQSASTTQLGTQQSPVRKNRWGVSDKTFWDWLQLLVVPIVLAMITFGFSMEQSHISDINSQKQHDTDIQIATDQQQQTLLQDYMSYITSLILGVNTGKDSPTLTNAKLGDEISQVARAQTLTTVARLDSKRKGFLLRFLYETKLIKKNHPLIDLSGADLSNANLTEADLNGVNLSNANMENVNLSEATLNGVTFDGAKLRYANLIKASLTPLVIVSANQTNTSDTSFVNADLSVALLSIANLQEAILTGANLIQANLVGANLKGANLEGATYNTKKMDKDIYGQSFTDEKGNPIKVEPTQFDPEFNPKAAGAICVDC